MSSEESGSQYSFAFDEKVELEDVCDEVSQLEVNEIECETDPSCVVVDEESETRVIKTTLRLCRSKYCEGCKNLHLCKLYLFGECPYHNKSEDCQFSHDFYSDHNIGVLCQHKLLDLDCSELCITLLQNDNTLLPSVCLPYNEGSGEFGNCPEAEECKNLHVCEKYIRGTCEGSTGCSRCHDLYEPHPLKMLQDSGVSNHLMAILLEIYRNRFIIEHADRTRINSSDTEPEKWWICLFHFQNSCNLENTCENVHFHLPYKWEQWDGYSWKDLPDNEEIEQAFSDPTKTYSVLSSNGSTPINFDTMTQGSADVRRLSTISSVLDPSFSLTTKWIWYWEDENGNWILYGSSQGTHNTSSLTSEFLEWKYQENSSTIIKFTSAQHSYEVNIQDMVQYDNQSNTKLRIRRRPKFLSAEDVQNIIAREMEDEDHSQNPRDLTWHSDKADVSVGHIPGFQRVLLNSDTDEYKHIAERFYQTMSEFNVKCIEKVLNENLWEDFQKHAMENIGKENNKLLFHGTESKHTDAICQKNIDWRICEAHETQYGKGIYFTRDAKASHSYTDKYGTLCMFVCRVFIGEYTTGHPNYIHPPLKDGETGIFYDSCVNDINNPSIFVVFEKHQVYPEYLIQYEQGAMSSPQHVSLNQFSPSSQATSNDSSIASLLSPQDFLPPFQYTALTPVPVTSVPDTPRLHFPCNYNPSLVRKFTGSRSTRPPKRQGFWPNRGFQPNRSIGSHRGLGPHRGLEPQRGFWSHRGLGPQRGFWPHRGLGPQRGFRPHRGLGPQRGFRPQRCFVPQRGFGPMHPPANIFTHVQTSASVRSYIAKQQVSISIMSTGKSYPLHLPMGISTVTKESNSKTQDIRHQTKRLAGPVNSTRSNSGLSPGTTSASASTHTDASKLVTSEHTRAQRVSSYGSRPRKSSDMESTKSAGPSSKTSTSYSTNPAGTSAKSSTSQSTKPAGPSSKTSASQSTKPVGTSAKCSASQSAKPAGPSNKTSASQSTKPAGTSAKCSAAHSPKPTGPNTKTSTSRNAKPACTSAKSLASQNAKPAAKSSRGSTGRR